MTTIADLVDRYGGDRVYDAVLERFGDRLRPIAAPRTDTGSTTRSPTRQAPPPRTQARGAGVVTLDDVIDAVCFECGLNRAELGRRSKTAPLVAARQAFVYLARRFTTASYPQIARAVGQRHPTAVARFQAAAARRERDREYLAGPIRGLARLRAQREGGNA